MESKDASNHLDASVLDATDSDIVVSTVTAKATTPERMPLLEEMELNDLIGGCS